MTTRSIPLPYFPTPPRDYSPQFFAEFLRAFSNYMQQAQNPGEGRATFMVFTDLQSHDTGLEFGSVFQVNGVLHVAMQSIPYPEGMAVMASVGEVTVVV